MGNDMLICFLYLYSLKINFTGIRTETAQLN